MACKRCSIFLLILIKILFAKSQVILSNTACRAREENIVEADILMKIKELQLDVMSYRRELWNKIAATKDLLNGLLRSIPTGKL